MVEWFEAHPVVGGGVFALACTLLGTVLGWLFGRKDLKDAVASAAEAARAEVGAHGVRISSSEGTFGHLRLDRI